MSKAAKRSLLILIILLLATLGFATFTVIEKQAAENEVAMISEELEDTRDKFVLKEKKYVQDANKLATDLKTAGEEKNKLAKKIETVTKQAEEQISALSEEISKIASDRDKWKRRIDTIRAERDQLMVKIDGLNKKLEEKPKPETVYKEKIVPARVPSIATVMSSFDMTTAPSISMDGKVVDEEYWAKLIQQKASLEINIQKLKGELSEKSIELVEIKQSNDNLKLEVDDLKHQKEDVEIEIQHKADMIDNISLELARTKNDKKFIANRVEKLNTENGELRQQMKQLISVKNALEKSIVKLSREKDKMEGKLGQTETIIQSKIDEIWEIKDDLDRSIRESQTGNVALSEVELPPIVVNSNGRSMSYDTGTSTGFNGKVISVNGNNNFVIVDVGENVGVRLGDNLSVYRDSKYIARLEVIQVRKDISAADLKDQWSKVKIGDVIR